MRRLLMLLVVVAMLAVSIPAMAAPDASSEGRPRRSPQLRRRTCIVRNEVGSIDAQLGTGDTTAFDLSGLPKRMHRWPDTVNNRAAVHDATRACDDNDHGRGTRSDARLP